MPSLFAHSMELLMPNEWNSLAAMTLYERARPVRIEVWPQKVLKSKFRGTNNGSFGLPVGMRTGASSTVLAAVMRPAASGGP